jgi:hypothetical protein
MKIGYNCHIAIAGYVHDIVTSDYVGLHLFVMLVKGLFKCDVGICCDIVMSGNVDHIATLGFITLQDQVMFITMQL